MTSCWLRNHDRLDDDDDQHGSEVSLAPHLIRQGDRHLPRHVFRLRLRRPARVCRRQLYLLGGEGEKKRKGETEES